MNLPEGPHGPVGPTGCCGAAGAPVSEEMRTKIMADVESCRPEPHEPFLSLRALGIIALLSLWFGLMIFIVSSLDEDDTPRDAHGVPCTVSMECGQ